MFYLFVLLFILLSSALFATVFRTGKIGIYAKVFRICVVVSAVGIFTYYFVTRSLTQFRPNSLTVQLINNLPLPLDFYIVKSISDSNNRISHKTTHVGSIRSNFYRIEYLDMTKSDEFWVVGFMGRKNMVYFSQHSVPNKNEDQIIEVRNYINQSQKLSENARIFIEELKAENMKTAIWITLDLLLLFLNFALLFRKFK